MAHSPFDIYRLLLVIFVLLYAFAALTGMLWSRAARTSRGAACGLPPLARNSTVRAHLRDLLEIAGLTVALVTLVMVQL